MRERDPHYTPNENEVRWNYMRAEKNRDIFRHFMGAKPPLDDDEYAEEFHRWLAGVKAQVLREAAERLVQDAALMETTNGYLWIPHNSLKGASRWLKGQANRIERGEA